MDLQNRYDELDNIISTLSILIDDITDKHYIEMLQEIKWEAEHELDEVEDKLLEERDKEEKEQNYQFERSRI